MKYLFPLFLSLALAACAKPDKDCFGPHVGHGPTRLIAFGDSQTAGHATETSTGCGYSWANILSEHDGLELVNTAVAGSQFVSPDQFDTLMDFDFKATDEVKGVIGYNDMVDNGLDPVHLEEFKTALTVALQRVSPRVKSITLGTCLTPPVYKFHASPEAVAAYRQATRDVVAALKFENVSIVDVDGPFIGDLSYYVADEVHLNLKAQAIVAGFMETP